MYCPKCGEKLPDDAQFCMKCGKTIPQNSNQEQNSVNRPSSALGEKDSIQDLQKNPVYISAKEKFIYKVEVSCLSAIGCNVVACLYNMVIPEYRVMDQLNKSVGYTIGMGVFECVLIFACLFMATKVFIKDIEGIGISKTENTPQKAIELINSCNGIKLLSIILSATMIAPLVIIFLRYSAL